jgi:hypothetical protein
MGGADDLASSKLMGRAPGDALTPSHHPYPPPLGGSHLECVVLAHHDINSEQLIRCAFVKLCLTYPV